MCSPHTARLHVIISCTDPFERKLKLTTQFLSHLHVVTFLLQLVRLDILHARCHSSAATIYMQLSVYLNNLHSVICLAQEFTSRHLSGAAICILSSVHRNNLHTVICLLNRRTFCQLPTTTSYIMSSICLNNLHSFICLSQQFTRCLTVYHNIQPRSSAYKSVYMA